MLSASVDGVPTPAPQVPIPAAGYDPRRGAAGDRLGRGEGMTYRSGASRAYRVVQWGTGWAGRQAIPGILAHPDLELVGVYVTSDAKDGRDAGELADDAHTTVDDVIKDLKNSQ